MLRSSMRQPESALYALNATRKWSLNSRWQMDWLLIVVLASTSSADKFVSPITVPVATEQLCNAARAKLLDTYKRSQAANFMFISECLQVR